MSDTALVVNEEQQELDPILQQYAKYPKLYHWCRLFLDKNNPETFGNRAASALIAYHLDRNDPRQYGIACNIGSQNYRKLQFLASAYYEQDGFSVAKQLDLLAVKATESNNAKFLQMFLEINGVYNLKAQIVINNTQNNQTNINQTVRADDPEIAQFNRDFEEFLELKYNKKVNPPTASTESTG